MGRWTANTKETAQFVCACVCVCLCVCACVCIHVCVVLREREYISTHLVVLGLVLTPSQQLASGTVLLLRGRWPRPVSQRNTNKYLR